MWKKKIMIAFYILILAVTVSFAWMDVQDNSGHSIDLLYGYGSGNKLSVASTSIEMMVEVEMATDEWKYLGSSEDKNQSGALMSMPANKVIPGAGIPFRIKFKNSSDEPISIRLLLGGTCHKDLIQYPNGTERVAVSFISHGTGSFTKYNQIIPTPPRSTIKLKNDCIVSKNDETGIYTFSVVLYESIQIPPTTGDEYVEIMCTVYFDTETMTNECAGKTFIISSFGATQK